LYGNNLALPTFFLVENIMAKKKKNKNQTPQQKFKNNPFGEIKKLEVSEERTETEISNTKMQPSRLDNLASQAEDDDDLFLRAVEDVKLYESPQSAPIPVMPDLKKVDEEAEAQLELIKLVNGELPFDISNTDEYVEGNVRGLPSQVLKKLRRGEYSLQDQLDLHGKTKVEARDLVEKFVTESRVKGLRCVLLVHGRGIHSKDNIPVLKESLRAWFERGRGRIGSAVLAFSSARPADGGLGAMYVLLRKNK